jgi:SAM-dependent methyltransferase
MRSGSSLADLRKPHAVLDLPSRQLKALKIERILDLEPRSGPIALLEIGCGSGGISHYFATHESLRCEVHAVDVADNRLVREGYAFHLVKDVHLPFPDARFDVVITNHVIEHVGDKTQQSMHLKEVARVMKPAGMGYLAVPNRWQLVEPHYRLAFLSWLPRPLRSPYLGLSGKGTFYDCEPLSVPEVEKLLAGAGFAYESCSTQATRLLFELERPGTFAAMLARRMPDAAFRVFRRLIPTLVYRLRTAAASRG